MTDANAEDRAEWFCERENVVHPTQRQGRLLQPCPDCGDAMVPTSPNLREIQRLRGELAEERAGREQERALHIADLEKLTAAVAHANEQRERAERVEALGARMLAEIEVLLPLVRAEDYTTEIERRLEALFADPAPRAWPPSGGRSTISISSR